MGAHMLREPYAYLSMVGARRSLREACGPLPPAFPAQRAVLAWQVDGRHGRSALLPFFARCLLAVVVNRPLVG
jgi:hypothetical protein